MPLNTVTLTWDLTSLIQSGLQATLYITPTAELIDTTDKIIVPQVTLPVNFTGSGQLAGIVANDNANILPAGTGYNIYVATAGGQVVIPQFTTQIKFSNGATQDLSSLAQVPSVTTLLQYLPLPSGTPQAGQVPVAAGSGEASAWGSGGGGGTVQSVTAADTSVVVGGTAANPTVRTNTLDVVAADHPPAASWSNNSQKITSLANGTAAQDAAAFGQIPASLPPNGPAGGALSGTYPNPGIVLDSATADIQPSPATAAAGSAGKPADAGHVHGQPPVLAPTGLTGATSASRYGGATSAGPPLTGTWAAGDFVVDQTGSFWVCVASGTPGSWNNVVSFFPYQFPVTRYGATGNGQVIGDGAMTATSATLTTPGLSPPSAPTVSNSGTGGTILAGTYQAVVTYVNKYGETLASSATSTTTSGSTSTITITSPAAVPGATGWYAYVTQPGGSTFTRQQAAGSPTPVASATFGIMGQLLLTAPPTSSGANPPGSNTSQSNPFTSADVGKAIVVKGAAASGVTSLVTTISGFTSSGQVTLAATAATSVSQAVVMWATDDTAAFQSAVNAAFAYAQAHAWYAEIIAPTPPSGAFYGIAGALSHANSGNAQITIPVNSVDVQCMTLAFVGTEDSSALRHWDQLLPQTGGTCLMSFGVYASASAQTTDLNAHGQSAMIGGPTGASGYGTGVGRFSNMNVILKGLNLLTTHSANGWSYGAAWLWGVDQAAVFDVGYGSAGLFAMGDYNNAATFSNGVSIGIGLPAPGNQNHLVVRNLQCAGGYTYGLFAGEHTDIQGCTIFYCWAGLVCVGGSFADGGTSSAAATHKVVATEVGIEGCTNFLYIYGAGSGGRGPKIKASLDIESGAPTISGTSAVAMASALGEVTVSGTYTPGNIAVSNPVSLVIIDAEDTPLQPGTWTLTVGTAFKNPKWRFANVILLGGASLTTVGIGATMGTASAPSMTTVYSQTAGAFPALTVRVPPGGWLLVSGSGSPTAPTANVTYD